MNISNPKILLFRKRAEDGKIDAKKTAYKIQEYNNWKVDKLIESFANEDTVIQKPSSAMLWVDLAILNKPSVYKQYQKIINSKYTSNDAFQKLLVKNKADKNLNRIVESQVNRIGKNLDYVETVMKHYEAPLKVYHRMLEEQENRSVANRRQILQETINEPVSVNRYNVNYRDLNVLVEQQMNEIRSSADYEECQAMNDEAVNNGKSEVITEKKWVWTHYGKTTRHSDMNSYPVIDFKNTFQVEDENTGTLDELLYPRDVNGSPENVYGCVCEIDYF